MEHTSSKLISSEVAGNPNPTSHAALFLPPYSAFNMSSRANASRYSDNRALVPYVPQIQAPKNPTLRQVADKRPVTIRRSPQPSPVAPPQPKVQLKNKYEDLNKMQECSLRLLKARAAPFSVLKASPCNTSATATNTVRFSTYQRLSGMVGSSGVGFAALRTTGATKDKDSCAVSNTATYNHTGIVLGDAQVHHSTMNGSLFSESDLIGAAANIRVRRVACGVQITPTAAALSAKGYFQTWSAVGNIFRLTIDGDLLNGDRTVPVSTYAPNTKYLNTWTPATLDDENFSSTAGDYDGIDTAGCDLAVVWRGATAGDTFIAEFVCYYEAETFGNYSGMAHPSEYDPKGAAAVNTAMTKIVRNHIATPSSSADGFFSKAWDMIKDSAEEVAHAVIPGLVQKGAGALLALL